jgi:hypothetical protein
MPVVLGVGLTMAVTAAAQGGGQASPQRPPADPAVAARGKALYGVNWLSAMATTLAAEMSGQT